MLNRKETHKITSILLIQNRFPFTVKATFHFRSLGVPYMALWRPRSPMPSIAFLTAFHSIKPLYSLQSTGKDRPSTAVLVHYTHYAGNQIGQRAV